MKNKLLSFLDFVIYWSIVMLPFSVAIAIAPISIFEGTLIVSFLIKRIILKKVIIKNTTLYTVFLLFLIASLVSVYNSINLGDSIKGLLKLIRYLFVFMIIAQEIKDKRQILRIIGSMACGICLVSLDSIWQVITGKDFIRGYSVIINIGLKRATASFSDANVLGIYLSAILPMIAAMALYYFKKIPKLLVVIAAVLGLTALLLTYSRPALLAFFLSLLFLSVVKRDKILLAVLIILTAISPFVAPLSVKNFAKEVSYNPLRFFCNDDRIAVYRNTFNMIKKHPMVGLGVNTYMKNYRSYKEHPEYRNVVTSDFMYAHNNFLQMLAETGFIGLGIFIWFLYFVFEMAYKVNLALSSEFWKNTSFALIACLIGFLVNGLTESSLYYSRVSIIFWYLIGLSVSLRKFVDAD